MNEFDKPNGSSSKRDSGSEPAGLWQSEKWTDIPFMDNEGNLRSVKTAEERICGGILGLLIGDALGVPYEFHSPNNIPQQALIDFQPPLGFQRSHPSVPPGTWSDDGAQALCLLASLLDCGRLDPEDLGRRLLEWYDHGYMAVDSRVFDVGNQTHRALGRLRAGVPATTAGPTEEAANGNGSLMRSLPLALWHQGSDAELVADARAQSKVTHGHLRSQLCCALYCLWARNILKSHYNPLSRAVESLRELLADEPPALDELEVHIRPDSEAGGSGSGYVVDCLHSARWAYTQGRFEIVVRAAVGLGNDTDTTACVAGGVAGLNQGLGSIPLEWQRGLRGQELVEPLLQRLIAKVVSSQGTEE